MWGGSAEVGGRGTNIDGANRNGAYGNTAPLSATNPVTPFTGPSDDAKAQEYQNINSAPIGVIDVRGSNRNYYLRAFGEEFGRDDQFINVVGGGFNSWKAAIYNNDIPHNYSFNALTPLTNVGSTLLGFSSPSGTYPPSPNPNAWDTWNYGTQRNTTGREFRSIAEVAVVHPRRLQRGQDERHQAGERPARNGLRQRLHRVRRPGRLQDAEHDHRGRVQHQAVRAQAGVHPIEVHRQQRFHAVAELLHAQRAGHHAAAAGQRAQEVEHQRLHQAAAVGFGDHRAVYPEQADEQHRPHRGTLDLEPQADEQRRQRAGQSRPAWVIS